MGDPCSSGLCQLQHPLHTDSPQIPHNYVALPRIFYFGTVRWYDSEHVRLHGYMAMQIVIEIQFGPKADGKIVATILRTI